MEAPEPQGYLTESGVEIYWEIVKHLEAVDALDRIDSFGLSIMADALETYQLACEKVKELGHVQTYKTGATAPSAWMNVKKQSYEMFLKLSPKFGLTIKDREALVRFKGRKKTTNALDEI